MAHKLCYLVHMDVSFGNVLIRPRLAELENGQCGIAWQGLLSDWELAKDYRITRAPQSKRAVSLSLLISIHPLTRTSGNVALHVLVHSHPSGPTDHRPGRVGILRPRPDLRGRSLGGAQLP